MGVEGLRGYFDRNPEYKDCFDEKVPEVVSSYFIDFNGIIYDTAAEVYKTKQNLKTKEYIYPESDRKKLLSVGKEKLESRHFKEITDHLSKLINRIKPRDNLIIAVDSSVNSAKLQQQKERRFPRGNREKDPLQIFDTNTVTPGTEFMIRLDKYLENWLKNYDGYLPQQTVYSSHLNYGEGEHKILEYIRQDKLIKGTGSNILYGKDGDLIILASVSELPNFVIENPEKKQFMDIEKFKDKIFKFMGYNGSNKKTVINDFCLTIMLKGNDFLRKFPNIPKLNSLIPIIFSVYKIIKKELTDEDNLIIWENYYEFMKTFSKWKLKSGGLYIDIWKSAAVNKYRELEDSVIIMDKKSNFKTNQVYNPEKHYLKFDIVKFKRDWYNKQFNPDITQWDGEKYYKPDNDLINQMKRNYLETLQWVQLYYTKGINYITNLNFYHYLFTPEMGDLVSYLGFLIREDEADFLVTDISKPEKEIEITVMHQLLSVFPLSSLDLIPIEYHSIYKQLIKLGINPVEFDYVDDGYEKEHQRLPILPPVNIPTVDDLIKKKRVVLDEKFQQKTDMIILKEESISEVEKDDFTVFHEELI